MQILQSHIPLDAYPDGRSHLSQPRPASIHLCLTLDFDGARLERARKLVQFVCMEVLHIGRVVLPIGRVVLSLGDFQTISGSFQKCGRSLRRSNPRIHLALLTGKAIDRRDWRD